MAKSTDKKKRKLSIFTYRVPVKIRLYLFTESKKKYIMVEVFTSKKNSNIIVYKYSKRVHLEDIHQTNDIFKSLSNPESKIIMICDFQKVSGFPDKDFIIESVKYSRQYEKVLNTIVVFGLKNIFYYLYKLFLSFTSPYHFQRVLLPSLEETEIAYGFSFETDFECIFTFDSEIKQVL